MDKKKNKTRNLGFRVTLDYYNDLMNRATAMKMSISTYIRYCLDFVTEYQTKGSDIEK